MHPFVLRAESARLSRDAIEALSGEIPRDVGQVDGLLEECIDGYFARAFTTAAGIVLDRLIAFEEWGALRDFFGATGVGGVEDHVWDAASAALRAGKPDTARSLVKMAPLPASAERPPAEDDASDHDSDAEPDDANVALSFRIPVFSRKFRSSAEALPDPIRRRAVILTSRIAAGDETAFRGTRRLRLDRDLYRQRVGREQRLIFRMHAQELEAVDLVPRKDLERTIRELSRG